MTTLLEAARALLAALEPGFSRGGSWRHENHRAVEDAAAALRAAVEAAEPPWEVPKIETPSPVAEVGEGTQEWMVRVILRSIPVRGDETYPATLSDLEAIADRIADRLRAREQAAERVVLAAERAVQFVDTVNHTYYGVTQDSLADQLRDAIAAYREVQP